MAIDYSTQEEKEYILSRFELLTTLSNNVIEADSLTRVHLDPQNPNDKQEQVNLRHDIEKYRNDRDYLLPWIKENHDWLTQTYSIDRLTLITQMVDLFFECNGAPPSYPFWSIYKTLRGPRPTNLHPEFSFYYALRYHFRIEDKKFVITTCRDFLDRHPEAIGQLLQMEIPTAFPEIKDAVREDELFKYFRHRFPDKFQT